MINKNDSRRNYNKPTTNHKQITTNDTKNEKKKEHGNFAVLEQHKTTFCSITHSTTFTKVCAW